MNHKPKCLQGSEGSINNRSRLYATKRCGSLTPRYSKELPFLLKGNNNRSTTLNGSWYSESGRYRVGGLSLGSRRGQLLLSYGQCLEIGNMTTRQDFPFLKRIWKSRFFYINFYMKPPILKPLLKRNISVCQKWVCWPKRAHLVPNTVSGSPVGSFFTADY